MSIAQTKLTKLTKLTAPRARDATHHQPRLDADDGLLEVHLIGDSPDAQPILMTQDEFIFGLARVFALMAERGDTGLDDPCDPKLCDRDCCGCDELGNNFASDEYQTGVVGPTSGYWKGEN